VIDVSRLYPGKEIAATNITLHAVEGQLISPRDACICGIPLAVSNGTIALKLKKHRYAAIRLRSGPPDAPTCPGEFPAVGTEAFLVKSYHPSDWTFSNATVQDLYAMGNGRLGVKVTGISDPRNPGRLSAARLTSHKLFGRDCTIGIRIRHSKCLYFGIGRSGIFHDSSW
jgi:hypothetical protein